MCARESESVHPPPTAHPTTEKSSYHHKNSTVRQGRDSGGVIIWYKSKFHNHINTVKQGKYYTWLKIHKELLSSRKDIFLCAIYIPPSESPYYSEDTFSTLEEETSHFQAQGNVLICGDLNARTGLHRHTREQIHQQQTDLLITHAPISTEITMIIQ